MSMRILLQWLYDLIQANSSALIVGVLTSKIHFITAYQFKP